MKKLKMLFSVVAMLMLFSVGALFGCGDKYANMKITTDLVDNTVVLYLDQEEEEEQDLSKATFNISISGVGGDISKDIKMPYGGQNIVRTTISRVQNTNKTQVTLSAINCGEADMIFTTEEGGKTITIHVSVEYRLKSLTYNPAYKPYALVGATTKINTAKCLTFLPSETTQKEVTYQMVSQYQGVELLPNGTIITSADAHNGTFRVKATSKANDAISTGEFDVSVIAGVEELGVKYEGESLEISDSNLVFEEDALYLSSNMIEESYKILEISALPTESNFVYNFAFTDLQGNQTSRIKNGVVASSVFECNYVDDNHIGITALTDGDELLKITAYIDGYEYISKPYYIKLHSEQVAKNITVIDVDNAQSFEKLTIYDEYNGGQGKAIKIEVGNTNATNRNFAVRIAEDSKDMADKIRILTGKRDKDGNLIPAKLFTRADAEYDTFGSGTILYVMAVKEHITGDSTDIINVEFVAVGTMGLLGQEVYKSVKFDLKIGVSEITLENETFANVLYVPIKETINGTTLVESTELKLLTQENEYTYSIQTNSLSDGYYIQKEVTYQDSFLQGNARQYTFEIYGIKEGVYTLNFFAQNGINIDIKIRVFTRVDELTITTNSVEQNSDIGKIEYKQTASELPTLEGGEFVLKLGGSANLNINAYYEKYLRKINYQSITYDFENENVVRIDSTNRIYGYNKGQTKVTARILVFDDSDPSGVKTYGIEFNVVVYIALQSATLNTKNITIYTKSTLGDYIDENGVSDQQKYGEFTFILKINPEKTEIDPDNDINVVWSGSEKALLQSTAEYEYNETNNTYKIKIGVDSLPITKETGNARLTITVSQYGRIIIQDASITIKNAKKVDRIYDVKKVQDRVSTNLTLYSESPSLYRDNTPYKDNYDYYLYFDARDITNGGISFTLDEKINPTDALNPKLIYKFRKIGDFDNIVNISNDVITVLGNGGLGYIDICAVDSYSASGDIYSTYTTILLKVADGLTKSTSLEVSSVNDLLKINTANGLDKFYIQTKNLNLSSQSNWTPIGYINGELYEFNGNYDGLISSDIGEEGYATISGIRLVSYANDTKSYYGLFAKLSEDSVIENLNIDILNVNINSSAENLYVGAVAGYGLGEIRNVRTNFINGGYDVSQNVNITAQNIFFGGIIGQNGDELHTNSYILNVYSSGKINISATNSYIGGLVGLNYARIDGATTFFNQSQFNYSFNSDMDIVATNLNNVGGIVGTTYAQVQNVSFAGTLIAGDNVGGIAGQAYALLYNTYSCGYIEAHYNVGGLVGYLKGNLSKSSVNMFNEENLLKTAIVAEGNVGGLAGYVDFNSIISNAYARSYIKPDKENFEGDIKVETENAYVGGLIGYAKNIQIQKAYSILKINAPSAKVGGLVGYADTVNIFNSFERNTANLTALAVAEAEGTNTLQYFYSSNNGAVGIDGENVKVNVPEQTELNYWTDWHITTQSSTLSLNDWYIKPNETYPFIIFNDNGYKLLTVEPPSSINIAKKDSGSLTNYLYEIDNLADTYVLYRGKNSVLRFNNLFNVSVLPQDELLNIAAEYSLSSSNPNIVQITGRTSMDYKLKLNSTGKVILKLTSKFSSDVSKEITIYVLNAVRDFEIKSLASQNLLVGTQYELVSSLSKSYVNNEDYYIKYDNNTNGKILINGSENATVWHKNNEKVFITSTKSGPFKIKYSLYTRLVIDNVEYNIPLINDNLSGVEEIKDKELSFNFIYGIKDFLCDTTILETGLNDYANIKYTLTGDDLRIVNRIDDENNEYLLPKFEIKFTKNSEYWKLKLVYVNVYIGNQCYVLTNNKLNLDENDTNKYNCQYNLDSSDELYIALQNNNNQAGVDNRVFKVEYLFEIKVDSTLVQNQFKANVVDEKFQSNLTATASIVNSGEINETNTKQNAINLIINRQKLDNIALSFYTNAEKTKDENDNDIYTINEVPSNAIISGQTGMLKIALAPVNAEIKNVKVTYQSEGGYNLSMLQVLKHTTLDENDNSKEIVDYVVRKPYAIATDNGTGLELYYNESNWYKGTEITPDYTDYDGFLYVNCIISSSVPTNSVFYITVDVIYINNYHLSSTIDLISRLPSTISVSYNFNQQPVKDKAYLPINLDKEFYVDFVEIVEPENILGIEQMLNPQTIFGVSNIKFVKNSDESIKMTSIGSGYRIYYSINSSTLGEQIVQAKVTKVKNGIQTTFQSNSIRFNFVDFVITGVKINDGGNGTNIITVPQSTTKRLDVSLEYDIAQNIDDEGVNQYPIQTKINNNTGSKTIAAYIAELTAKINTTMNCWFGRNTIRVSDDYDLSKYYPLAEDANHNYENYYIYDKTLESSPYIAVGVKHVNTTAIVYNEIAIKYDLGYPEYASAYQSEYIGNNKLGLVEKSGKYIQYIRDDVTLNLVSDVSSKNPIPIQDETEFLQMTNGEEGKMLYYALTKDLTLDNYTPMNIQNISLDGNMYTITINSFKTYTEDEEGNVTYNSQYGLFEEIGANSIVQNLTVEYNGLVADSQKPEELITKLEKPEEDISIDFGLSSFSFGGVCAQNNGIIYNVNTKLSENLITGSKKLKFTNNTANQNYIAGICANNSGYISYSTSELSIEVNCGYVAGFVAVNAKKISNSKVLMGSVTNTFTSDKNSLTGGFVARNSGDIFGCYIGESHLVEVQEENPITHAMQIVGHRIIYDIKIESRSTVGGFINENRGTISNCYSNVQIISTTRASGFVFDNSGSVESCYSSSSLEQNSNAHTPFVGTNEFGTATLNAGEIEDCYYITSKYEFTSITPEQAVATRVETNATELNAWNGENTKKSSYAKFVFADGANKLNGIWDYSYNENNGNPYLIDANLSFYSRQVCNGLKMEEDGTASYSWTFENSPAYGKQENGLYNPRILTDINDWSNILGQKDIENQSTEDISTDIFVLLKDIVASRDETPATSKISFKGILFGNNMQISNLYLRAEKNTNNAKSFGLFREITDIIKSEDNNITAVHYYPIIKDLNIIAKQVMASNARNVGTLAGYINNASIININIDCSAVEAIQGRNMVGAFAGLVNNSTITKINATGSVNAGYIDKTYEFANYYVGTNGYDDDLKILTEDGFEGNSFYTNDAPYSYAGTLTGALLGTTTATFINITGDNKVIGYYAGSIVGLVDEHAKLVLANTKLVAGQYVRAYAISGGVVGENRGIIDRTYIEHEKLTQEAIDADLSTTASYGIDGASRNLTFFRGSPYFIGGFVGFNNGGTITNSYSKLDVRTTTYVTFACGGFVGLDVGGDIQNCYATGSVIGVYNIGGFIGAVSNEQTLLGSTIGLSAQDTPLDTPERNNIDALSSNSSAPIFLSNYEYSKGEIRSQYHGTYKYQNGSDTGIIRREAYICKTNDLYLKNNFASNKWLFGHERYDSMGLSDSDYLQEAVVGLFIGAVVDHQANQTQNLPVGEEAINNMDIDTIKATFGVRKTTLDSVFNTNMLEEENGEYIGFASDCKNYINSQAYQIGKNPLVNQQNIARYTDGEILEAILSYIPDSKTTNQIVVPGEDESEIIWINDEIVVNERTVKIGMLMAIEYRSIGEFKDKFLFTDDISDLPTNLCKCEANKDDKKTLITFANLVKRDELLVDEDDGLFSVYSKNIFILPEYAGVAINTSPIYPRIICNINISLHN